MIQKLYSFAGVEGGMNIGDVVSWPPFSDSPTVSRRKATVSNIQHNVITFSVPTEFQNRHQRRSAKHRRKS